MRQLNDFISLIDTSTSEVYRLPINPADIDFGIFEFNDLDVLDGFPVRSAALKDYVDGTFAFYAVPEKYKSVIALLESLVGTSLYVDLEYCSYISHIKSNATDIEIVFTSVDVEFNYRGHTKFNLVASFKRKVFDYEI